MKSRGSSAAGGFFLLGIFFSQIFRALACGPDFPNQMLDRGDDAVLAAPIADFDRELERIHLVPANFQAVITTNDYASQTLEGDLADLRAALRKTDLSKITREKIVTNYEAERVKLLQTHVAIDSDSNGDAATENHLAPVAVESVSVPIGLPEEFADYFRGSIAWHLNRTNEARVAWETLLQLSETNRHFRSTWAAYMLGRSWQGDDNDKAIQYFQQVPSLAKSGFADRLGLAAASIGWEAQIELRRKHFGRAIELYLQQLASGDFSAGISLRETAAAALSSGEDLSCLATNTNARRIITAFITSRRSLESLFGDGIEGVVESNHSIINRWLDAVETADVKDVESAEQLALAAYQAGKFEIAQRWIRRAKTTPVTQWLQAKLLLRSGKINEAAALLEYIARLFPLDDETNRDDTSELKNNLYVPGFTYVRSDIYPPTELLAEIGVLHLARREYVESLDALLRAGFWMDAAYVAERVLTLDELKNYVDRNWPAAIATNVAARSRASTPEVVQRFAFAGGVLFENVETNSDGDVLPPAPSFDTRKQIRYLLARRLTRMERGNEAREYYPAEQRPNFDALVQSLTIEAGEKSSSADRAGALWTSAQMTRQHGMELIGTEVEPDWKIHDGIFDYGVTIASRTNGAATLLRPSADELFRADAHGVVPEERFHYRYQAAVLAWEAALLMPNNSDATARVLCTAGSWLKAQDPETADVFYKSLVRRCRKTEIGKLADRMRWFPDLDENGNSVPWQPEPPTEISDDSNDAAQGVGYWFVLHRGDTLEDVAEAARVLHQLNVSAEEIQEANPSVNPNRLKAGLKIFVPAPELERFGNSSEGTPVEENGRGGQNF